MLCLKDGWLIVYMCTTLMMYIYMSKSAIGRLARGRWWAPTVGAVRLARRRRSQLLQIQPPEKLEDVLAGDHGISRAAGEAVAAQRPCRARRDQERHDRRRQDHRHNKLRPHRHHHP
jgi:hypothetical protein